MLPVGFSHSSLTRMSALSGGTTLRRRTSEVLPMASRMSTVGSPAGRNAPVPAADRSEPRCAERAAGERGSRLRALRRQVLPQRRGVVESLLLGAVEERDRARAQVPAQLGHPCGVGVELGEIAPPEL